MMQPCEWCGKHLWGEVVLPVSRASELNGEITPIGYVCVSHYLNPEEKN